VTHLILISKYVYTSIFKHPENQTRIQSNFGERDERDGIYFTVNERM
jgi:hypothetical protein